MSLKLSVRYDSNSKPAIFTSKVDDPKTPVLYLMAGMIPENLVALSTQTSTFRDLVITNILECPDEESVLTTFTQNIRSVEGLISNQTDIVYCEYAASIALAMGNMDLFKEILMRVDPTKLSPLLHTLYETTIKNKVLDSQLYRQMFKDSKENLNQTWDHLKGTLNIEI
jgi:hypothetical protein